MTSIFELDLGNVKMNQQHKYLGLVQELLCGHAFEVTYVEV